MAGSTSWATATLSKAEYLKHLDSLIVALNSPNPWIHELYQILFETRCWDGAVDNEGLILEETAVKLFH